MALFHKLYHSGNEQTMHVVDRDLGGFHINPFRNGVPVSIVIPENVRLYVEGEHVDYVINPISWPICSNKMVNILAEIAPNDFQAFDAPLFINATRERVVGYKVINIVRLLDCLDLAKSFVDYSKRHPGKLAFVANTTLVRSRIPDDVHVFRISNYKSPIIITDKLVNRLVSESVSGVNFSPCNTS